MLRDCREEIAVLFGWQEECVHICVNVCVWKWSGKSSWEASGQSCVAPSPSDEGEEYLGRVVGGKEGRHEANGGVEEAPWGRL